MKEAELRTALGKIQPTQTLVASTLEAMQREAVSPAPKVNRQWLRVLPAACLLLAALTAAALGLLREKPYQAVGTVAALSEYTAVVQNSRALMPAVAAFTPEEAVRAAFLAETQGKAAMVAQATVRSAETYTATDTSAQVQSFTLLQLELTEVDSCTGAAFHTFAAGDTLSAVRYDGDAPQPGSSCRFYLWTGADGSPDDAASKTIGLSNAWVQYACIQP